MRSTRRSHVGYQWFEGKIINITGNNYAVKFEDGSVENLILENLEWEKKDIESNDEYPNSDTESTTSSNDLSEKKIEDLEKTNKMLKKKINLLENQVQQLQLYKSQLNEMNKKNDDIANTLINIAKKLSLTL